MKHISEEDRIEYAKTIEDAAGRLADLIGNILKLNKLERSANCAGSGALRRLPATVRLRNSV